MKKNEVKIGHIYTAKVTDKIVDVRIDAENRHGGWDATNLATGKKIRIKSPARLRSAKGGHKSPTSAKKEKATKEPKAKTGANTAQTGQPRAKKPKGEKKVSGLDAAAKVLQESGKELNVKEILDAILTKGYWKSPEGKTPRATIYSSIIREIATKGKESRFCKSERGKFILNK